MLHKVLAVAAELYPGRRVRLEGEGQLCVAVRVGDELLVRFPRHGLGAERLAMEVRLLERIYPQVDMTVPDIVEVALQEPVGRARVAHRYLPGKIVRREDVASWPAARVQEVGAQVGAFLRDLHPLAPLALEAGVEARTAHAFATALADDFDELVAPRTGPAGRSRAQEETAALAALPDLPAVLCHTDLGGNILCDEATGAVAVIDFGSCMITHPAFDVATLSVLGEAFIAACVAEHPDLAFAVDHAAAARETFALQDVLYGARQQDWAYVEDALAGYATLAR